MDNKIVMISIAAVIGIIVLGSVLMPILDDATTTEETFTNNGLWRMAEIKNGDVWTNNSTDHKWTLNGEDIGVYNTSSNALLGPDWCARSNGQLRGYDLGGNATSLTATAGEITITFTGGQATAVQELPGYGMNPNGDYVILDYNSTGAYMNGDSVIFATGSSVVDGVSVIIHIEGNIDDGVTLTAYSQFYRPSEPYNNVISDVTFSNVAINYTEVSGYKDLYLLKSITADMAFTNTVGDDTVTSKSGSVTYSSYVVPYEVTAERSVHFTDGQNAIFAAIPVMIILAVLLGVVALVIRSRMD